METLSFNKDIHVLNTVDYLIQKLGINCIVETGTSCAHTTQVLGEMYPNIEIHTIEIIEETYDKSKEKLSKYTNITCHLGSSEKVLDELLPKLEGKKILFYLDAHWYDYWPIRDEISLVGKYFKDNAVIVIDDFSVPLREFQCDSYDGHTLSIQYIQEEMYKAYTNVFFFFNDKTNLQRAVGKIYIFPKQWLEYFKDTSEIWREEGNCYYSTI